MVLGDVHMDVIYLNVGRAIIGGANLDNETKNLFY